MTIMLWRLRLQNFVRSHRSSWRRVLSPLWGRITRRKVPCTRCKADMRKVGMELVECPDWSEIPIPAFGRTGLAGFSIFAYCPSCTKLAADLDKQVRWLQALIIIDRGPLDPDQIKKT